MIHEKKSFRAKKFPLPPMDYRPRPDVEPDQLLLRPYSTYINYNVVFKQRYSAAGEFFLRYWHVLTRFS